MSSAFLHPTLLPPPIRSILSGTLAKLLVNSGRIDLNSVMEPKIVLMDRNYSPDSLNETGPLDLRNIKPSEWETILAKCQSENLRLYHIMLVSLDGVERLKTTSSLAMEWANKIPNLNPVFKMLWLSNLFISDFPRITNIEGIEALRGLKTLHLSGNRGSLHPPLRLASIQPIAHLSNLEELTVFNTRLENDDISFLASLPKLRVLTLSNTFAREKFAFLAKRMNAQLGIPITAYRRMNFPCPTCGEALFYFIGKRMPTLCKRCESKRFEKLTHQFEELVGAA